MDLIEHPPKRIVQIDGAEENDVAIGADLAKIDRFQPGGLNVPQLLAIEQIEVAALRRN